MYLRATGGDPDAGIANPNLALMVALGPCTAVPSMSYIEMNELTTVAVVNALAPYMKSYTAVGSGSSDGPCPFDDVKEPRVTVTIVANPLRE